MKRFRVLMILSIAMLAIGTVDAVDFAIRIMPEATVPFDSTYSFGGGGTLTVDVELFNFMAPFLEAGYRGVAPLAITDAKSLLHLFNGGLGVSFFTYPISRLRLGIGAGGGLYYGMQGTDYEANVYWNARAEGGYRFSPGFSLSAACEYVQYIRDNPTPLLSGLSVGFTVNLNPWSLLSESSAALTVDGSKTKIRSIFPIIYSNYAKTHFGTVTIVNTESSEIQDVIVTFQCPYASQATVCRRIPSIPKGESRDVDLLATFSEQILTLSAETKVQGDLVVTYKLLDTPRTFRNPLTINLNGRSMLTWEDEKMLAAFASPNDPAVIEESKFLAGLIRDKIRSGIDSNLQYGMGLFESLGLSDVTYQKMENSYASNHLDKQTPDDVQFPFETLNYRTGDCDDLAVLYAALLESVGVQAAFIPMANDFCVAFPLLMEEAEARTTFIDPKSLIYKDGTPWVPVQMSQVRKGFLAAWQGGAEMYNAAATGTEPAFFTLEEGWRTFKPISLSDSKLTLQRPADDEVRLNFDHALTKFITREIGPKVQKAVSEMGPSGGTVKQQNALGVLYARYGMIAEAKAQFEKAAAKKSIPALTNLGNIAFVSKNYEDAVRYFQQVLQPQPDNKAAILGLARAMYEMDDFAQSDVLFAKVQQMDAPLANKYAYLSSKIEGSASRASAVADRNGMVWNEDSE